MRIGLIGGSGLYGIEGMETVREVSVATPFGEPSAPLSIGMLGDREIVFLPRHGRSHTIPPHRINYRANVWGLKALGVDRIISVGAVGGLRQDMKPGTVVLLDQIIDLTFGARLSTYYDGEKVVHIDFTEPYCPEMRRHFILASGNIHFPFQGKGTYVCVNGPRLETAREIEFFSRMGGDVVGMTAMPEAALARELEICVAGIAVATNFGAGISPQRLTTAEVMETMRYCQEGLKELIAEVLALLPQSRNCPCKDALKDAAV